jgi:hypothetical protein
MKSKIIFITSAMLSLAFAAEDEVAPLKCGKDNGKHIRLSGYDHEFLPASGVTQNWPNDMDVFAGANSVAGSGSAPDWTLMEEAAPGAKIFCENVAPVINDIGSDFFSYIDTTDEDINAGQSSLMWVATPNDWRSTVLDKLSDVACAMSPQDPAIIDYMKTQSYYYAQLKRMSLAASEREIFAAEKFGPGVVAYNRKLEIFQDAMKSKQDKVQKLLQSSRAKRPSVLLSGDQGRKGTAVTMEDVNYDQSAEFLLEINKEGDQAGVRGVLHGVRSDVAAAADDLETAAQIIKRNAIRYAKLNQISLEHERLESFKNRVREASYGLLRNCLVNYQISNEID